MKHLDCPPADAPAGGPLSALAAGHVTFCSFNQPRKFMPPVIAMWAEILRRVPGSRLVLKTAWIDEPGIRRCREGQFAERAGLHPFSVAKPEQGVQEPTWPTALDLAGVLGVSVGAFVCEGRARTVPKRPRGRPPKPKRTGPAPNRRGRQKTNREGSG